MDQSSLHYQVINNFFDIFSLPSALKLLDKLLHSAASRRIWPGPIPANAVYFVEKLTRLSASAFGITAEKSFLSVVTIDPGEADDLWALTRYETYCGRHRHSTPWHYFPRSLSQHDFCNPYSTLSQFTQYQTEEVWKETLGNLLHFALTPHTILELDENLNLLDIRLQLHKLIEAAHLIGVRSWPDGKRMHFNGPGIA